MQETRTITQYRQQLRHRIIETSMREFASNGIKAVKMDDIAQELGISKRTLYEIYENKEQLLFEVVKYYRELQEARLQAFINEGHTVMEIILFAYQRHAEEFKATSPKFYEEVLKYSTVVNYLEQDRRKNQHQFVAFMAHGVEEGYFRGDVNYQLVRMALDAMSDQLRSELFKSVYDFDELFINTVFVLLRGFCTEKGIAELDQFIKTRK